MKPGEPLQTEALMMFCIFADSRVIEDFKIAFYNKDFQRCHDLVNEVFKLADKKRRNTND